MDEIKFVIDELNQPPFNSSLNLIAYDGLRSEQRLDLLTAVLNTIDPKVGCKKAGSWGWGDGDKCKYFVSVLLVGEFAISSGR